MSAPERWQDVIDLVLAPVAWVPRLQEVLLAFFMEPAAAWLTAVKYVLLLFPALLGVGAIWITLLSLYTLPFRAGRVRFVSMMLLAWWDAARAVALYWAGVVRVIAVMVGWMMSLLALTLRLAVAAIRQLTALPFVVTGRVSQRITQGYFQPGVPWVAFVLLVAWCVLEATVFAHTMMPTVSGILSDLSGAPASQYTAGLLFAVLLLMIMGSYACLQLLADAVRTREFRYLAHVVVVEAVVMFFQVMFLYREFIDAISPWIMRDTGLRVGFWLTMTLACVGWLGIRAITWYLFAQHGAAPMMAFIARRPILTPVESAATRELAVMPPAWWRAPLADFERELEWLHAKGDQLLEYLALPTLQLFAAGLNFAMMIVAARPAFQLPFKTMKEVTDTREILESFHLAPRKM
jgi:hypothetical protein